MRVSQLKQRGQSPKIAAIREKQPNTKPLDRLFPQNRQKTTTEVLRNTPISPQQP
jgi:hypothetical protein